MKRSALLIGCGGWGAIHLQALAESRGWNLTAVADANPDALNSARRTLPSVRCFEDPLAAIDETECDLIAITIPNPHRVPILLHALRRGVPVHVEKPLAHTRRDLNRILRVARDTQTPITVSQNYRFEPQTRRLAEFASDRRQWGQLKSGHVDFRRSIRVLGETKVRLLPDGIALLHEMGIHHFDLMRLVLGQNPISIRARSRRFPGSAMTGWDTVDAELEFPSSTLVTYHGDFDAAADLTPWGARWNLDFEGGSLTWQSYAEGDDALRLHTPWRGRWPLDIQSRKRDGEFRHCFVDHVYNDLSRAMDSGEEPECALRDNLQSLAIAFAVEQAAKTGRAIDFSRYLEEMMKQCP